MILEAFSQTLKQRFPAEKNAARILFQWLAGYLTHAPSGSVTTGASFDPVVAHVLHAELEWCEAGPDEPVLASLHPRSATGEILLKSLLDYCQSYEDWQYRRWLHQLRASDFNSLQLEDR